MYIESSGTSISVFDCRKYQARDDLIDNLSKISVERCSLLYCSTYRDDIFINDERLISVILDILSSNHLKMSISILTLFYLFQVLILADQDWERELCVFITTKRSGGRQTDEIATTVY